MKSDVIPAPLPYLSHRTQVIEATDLMRVYGALAAEEAAARAEGYREIGNVHRFCRWRQIGRLVAVLAAKKAVGTIH